MCDAGHTVGTYDAGGTVGAWVTDPPDGHETKRKTSNQPNALSLPATKSPTLSHFLQEKMQRSLTG
jgi:hypothetical protein